MKLKLKDKWRWLAIDDDGETYAYQDKPLYNVKEGVWHILDYTREVDLDLDLFSLSDIKPGEGSLHEILPDGSLIKHVERPDLKVDDRVLVRGTDKSIWKPAHFKRWSITGEIVVFVDGKTSWTSHPDDAYIYEQWKLPEAEQK